MVFRHDCTNHYEVYYPQFKIKCNGNHCCLKNDMSALNSIDLLRCYYINGIRDHMDVLKLNSKLPIRIMCEVRL